MATTRSVLWLLVILPLALSFINVPLGRSYEAGGEIYINVTIGGSTIAVQVDSGSSTLAVPTTEVEGGLPDCGNNQLSTPKSVYKYWSHCCNRVSTEPTCVNGAYDAQSTTAELIYNCATIVDSNYTKVWRHAQGKDLSSIASYPVFASIPLSMAHRARLRLSTVTTRASLASGRKIPSPSEVFPPLSI